MLLCGGLRMVRYSWILTVIGSVFHFVALSQGWVRVDSPPWITIFGMSLSVVGLLRCALGSSQAGERFWIGVSALCLGMGMMLASTGSVILGYLAGAFCFHLFLIQLSRQVGCHLSETTLVRLLVMPFLALTVAIFIGLFVHWLGGIALALLFFLGPFLWVIRLVMVIYTLEQTLA